MQWDCWPPHSTSCSSSSAQQYNPSPSHSMTIWFVCHNHSNRIMRLVPTQTGDGIIGGLEANGPEFKVNGKSIRILSGSLHYFRFSLRFKASFLEHLSHTTGCTPNIGKLGSDNTRSPFLPICDSKLGCWAERCGRVCALEPARATAG